MANLFRPISVKPIPPGAEPCRVGREPAVRWRSRDGDLITARLTKNRQKCRVRSPVWWIEYRDEHGLRRRKPLSRDRAAAEKMMGEIVADVERARAGLAPMSGSVAVESLLVLAGQYRDHLRDLGRSAKHFDLTYQRIKSVLEECGWTRAADVTYASWVRWVGAQRENGLASESINHYLRAVRSLFNWLIPHRISADPLARATFLNADADRRIVRRVLEPGEFRRLIDATRKSEVSYFGLDGPDRAALYLMAGSTGLRAGELASLTAADVRLDAPVPFVVASAKRAKSRKAADLPLPAAVVDELRPWLEQPKSDPLLWPGTWHRNHESAELLRRDLRAAGIPPETADGSYDFHSLRSQYGTGLARAGVVLQVAQRLMRHSTPNLTAKFYTRLNLADLGTAADRLGSQLGRQSPEDPSRLGTGTGKKKRAKGRKKPGEGDKRGDSRE